MGDVSYKEKQRQETPGDCNKILCVSFFLILMFSRWIFLFFCLRLQFSHSFEMHMEFFVFMVSLCKKQRKKNNKETKENEN